MFAFHIHEVRMRTFSRWALNLRCFKMRKASNKLFAALICFAGLGAFTPVRAATHSIHSVLHVFQGGADGSTPYASLVRDAAGNLYGTTLFNADVNSGGYGAIFKVDAQGNETVLYQFTGGSDGEYPYAGLLLDSLGNLYGTASQGGQFGQGTVFQLSPSGQFTVLYTFQHGGDGNIPYGTLISDSQGNLYGTTVYGGGFGVGTVFEINITTHVETVLHAFTGGTDGGIPLAGLVRDALGNSYGVAAGGGDHTCNCGVVFKIDPQGRYSVLHTMEQSDGAGQRGSLIIDAAGNLYGTASSGGATGNGTVFKVDQTGTLTVLYSFLGGQDGRAPYASLARDASGNLFGTTSAGGQILIGTCIQGCGTVFKIDARGQKSTVYVFKGRTDGGVPFGGVVLDALGRTLYGTTAVGGLLDSSCTQDGCGTMFQLSPAQP